MRNRKNKTTIYRKGEKRKILGIPEDCYVISSIGRLDPMKDFESLLTSFKDINEEFSDSLLLIVGDGRRDIKQRLIELVEKNDLKNNVKLLGYREDVYEIILASDVVISSSLFGEGVSNVVIEAMALGIPVISTDVGDHKIVLENGRGDSDSLQECSESSFCFKDIEI